MLTWPAPVGLHARTDGFTSLAMVVGAFGVLAGVPLADPIVGLAITVAILFVLRGAATDILRRLVDAIEPELVDTAEASLRSTPEVRDVEQLRLRWIGHRIRGEAGIVVVVVVVVVDAGLGLVAAHDIATLAHHRLLHEAPKLDEVTVHVSPSSEHGQDHHTRSSPTTGRRKTTFTAENTYRRAWRPAVARSL